jgi:DNA-binding transcriptional ArsR family regulator
LFYSKIAYKNPSKSLTLLALILYFYNNGIMENKTIVTALAALAQESRLNVFRLLVQMGPEGLPAGKIAERLGIAASSLSFHLKELSHAGLLNSRNESRSIIYTANYSTMNALIEFLTENCCNGAPCMSVNSPICSTAPCEENSS